MSMPKFNFNQSAIKSKDDLDKALASGGKKDDSPYLRPGVYDVRVTSAAYADKNPSDPTWRTVFIELEDAGKKTIKANIMVPTSTFEYTKPGGKPTLLPFRKLNDFCVAAGLPQITDADSAGVVLTEYFARPEKTLVGKEARITVGYTRTYVDYAGKTESGGMKFVLRNVDGSTYADATGASLVFPDRDSAMAHAEQNQINIQRFADVTAYEAPKSRTKASDF